MARFLIYCKVMLYRIYRISWTHPLSTVLFCTAFPLFKMSINCQCKESTFYCLYCSIRCFSSTATLVAVNIKNDAWNFNFFSASLNLFVLSWLYSLLFQDRNKRVIHFSFFLLRFIFKKIILVVIASGLLNKLMFWLKALFEAPGFN